MLKLFSRKHILKASLYKTELLNKVSQNSTLVNLQHREYESKDLGPWEAKQTPSKFLLSQLPGVSDSPPEFSSDRPTILHPLKITKIS